MQILNILLLIVPTLPAVLGACDAPAVNDATVTLIKEFEGYSPTPCMCFPSRVFLIFHATEPLSF